MEQLGLVCLVLGFAYLCSDIILAVPQQIAAAKIARNTRNRRASGPKAGTCDAAASDRKMFCYAKCRNHRDDQKGNPAKQAAPQAVSC
jgi:hypothetical protein